MTDIPRTELCCPVCHVAEGELHKSNCALMLSASRAISEAASASAKPSGIDQKDAPQDLAGRLEHPAPVHGMEPPHVIILAKDAKEAAARIRTLDSVADMIAEEREAWKRSCAEWKAVAIRNDERAEAAEARALTAESQLAEFQTAVAALVEAVGECTIPAFVEARRRLALGGG